MRHGIDHIPRLLSSQTPHHLFPHPDTALIEPDGLLAIGGDLHPQRILHAYRQGIFPWYSDGQPILWWTPNPRCVLFPEQLKLSRSLRKSIRNKGYTVTFNQACPDVIRACATTLRRPINTDGTWLTDEMIQAYIQLHALGHVHSVECWHNEQLVGGLYGIKMGRVFFGESMFSRHTDASKVAFATLVNKLIEEDYQLIDCQVYSEHIASLGAEEIPRSQFLDLLQMHCQP